MNSNLYVFCVRCKKNARFICERCSDPYCTKTCQVMDWPYHRRICFPMPYLVEIPNDRNVMSMCDARNNESPALTYQHTNSQNQNRFVPKYNNNGRKNNSFQRPFRSQPCIKPATQELCDFVNPGSVQSLESKTQDSVVAQQGKENSEIALHVSNDSEEIIDLAERKESAAHIPLSTDTLQSTAKQPLNWDENLNENLKVLEQLMSNDSQNWQKHFPLVDDTFVTVVHFVERPTTNCWIVQNKHTTNVKLLQDELRRLHCNDGAAEVDKMILNEVYSVRYKDIYYRGVCRYQVNSKEVLVQLIDVGLTFQAQTNALRKLEPRLKTINAFAVEINFETSVDVSIGQILRIHRFSVYATGTMNVKLGQEEKLSPSTSQSIEIKTLPLPEGVSFEMFCLDYSNVGKGYISACIHDAEKIESINQLSDKISKYLTSLGKAGEHHFPKINEICFAFHDCEDQWYRAECIASTSADRFEMIFIDYGITRIVNSSNLRKFVSEFSQPAIMHFCCIKGLPPKPTNELIKKVITFFNENPFFMIESAKYDDGVVIVDCPALLNAIR